MKRSMTILLLTLELIQILSAPVYGAPVSQFDQFFPAWNVMLQAYLSENCTVPYTAYKTGHVTAAGKSSLVTPVIECILDQFPEFRKSEMAASAEILGLLPTIL